MSELAKLRKAKNLSDLAILLGFQPKSVSYILYKKPKAGLYKTFNIPKKTGGFRTIAAPCDELKLLQTKVSILLQSCVDEIEAVAKQRKVAASGSKQQKITSLAHGFKPKHSIVTNAKQHRNKNFVFNIDLHDFFGTIHFGRVQGFFEKNHDFKLAPQVAKVISQIVCHDKKLPQGSPSSPIVSNIIAHILDIRLAKLAAKNNCTYSRYADDITFSTNKKEFPQELGACVMGEENVWTVAKPLNDIDLAPEKRIP